MVGGAHVGKRGTSINCNCRQGLGDKIKILGDMKIHEIQNAKKSKRGLKMKKQLWIVRLDTFADPPIPFI